MPRRHQYDATQRIGVNAVERIVLEQLNWIFREQPIADFGIDGEIEQVHNGRPTGQLIAVQIKTGVSYFRGEGDQIAFYVDDEHLKYWHEHSLPVILVLHNPETAETIWQWAALHAASKTEKGWRIEVPRRQVFGAPAKPLLMDQDWSDEPFGRRRRFTIDRGLMQEFDGRDAYVTIEVWVNKSLKIREIEVRFDDPEKDEPDYTMAVLVTWGYGISDVMRHFFPWLQYEYLEEPEEYSGEIEEHRLSVRLTDAAKGFLTAEAYFEAGLAEPDEEEAFREIFR